MTKRRPTQRQPRRWGDRLNKALLGLAIRGERVRCSDPVDHLMWTSENPDERASAARRCAGCEVFDLCGLAALERNEKWGVFAGVDFTRKTAKRD
jgi:Transcription factor WhiB